MPTPTPTPPPDWNEVQRWFSLALAQSAGQREAWLQASGASPAVQAEVLSLLAHASGGSLAPKSFLSEPAALLGRDPGPAAGAPAPRLGQRLGAWTLMALAGRGGMGEVYEARRDDGRYEGRAAVKLLRAGLDSAAVLARFAHEQQALARLDHPNIAHLLDAGHTEDGRPYFVMAWVDGQPIDRACQGRPVAERLRLFLQLADAVSHAHRHLLVHRDLKPGNVLVTPEGQVKLLDFGIAKALDPAEADPDRTQAGERPYTPHYASPEQVRGETVSTATDLYSLGVLLYVMLTGVRPYGRQATTPFDAARSVLEEAPSRASALSPDEVPDADWARTRRRLEGDLDNILLKALAKPVAERYASVDALAADIRAHLDGRPVSARAPTAAYLAARFIGRHRAAVGAAALAVLALLGGLATTTWQAREARRQRAAAEQRYGQVQALAHRLLFDYHDQIHLLPGSTAVREAMLRDARQYLDSLAAPAEAPQALLREQGVAYRRLAELYHADARPALGGVQASLDLLQSSIRLLRLAVQREPGDRPARYQLALALSALATSLKTTGELQASLAQRQASQALFDALAAEVPDNKSYRVEAVRAQMGLFELTSGAGSMGLGQAERAAAHLAQAAAAVQPLREKWPDDTDVLALYTSVLNLQWLQALDEARLEDGLALLRRITPAFERLQALEPANTLFARDAAVNLLSQGTALTRLGRHDEALSASREALRRMQALARADPANASIRRDVSKLQGDVGGSLLRLGRPEDAWPEVQAAVDGFGVLHRDDPQDRRIARGLALAQALATQVQAARGQRGERDRLGAAAAAQAARIQAAAEGDVSSTWLVATVHTQLAAAWADQAATACTHHRTALAAWQSLQGRKALRPLDAPRLAEATQAVSACGTP